MPPRSLTQDDRNNLALFAAIAGPVAGWGAAVALTETVPKTHALGPLVSLMAATLDKPVLLAGAGLGLAAGLAAAWAISRPRAATFSGAAYKRHLRGTVAASAAELARQTTERGARQITIAGIPLPTEAEPLNVLMVGNIGAGKSTLISEMALGALNRGDKLIVLDPDGAMLSKFFCTGDVVLNPNDARTAGWSFFNEIRDDYDFARLAKSIVPLGQTKEAEVWNGYGRLLLREVARKLHVHKTPDVDQLHHWVSTRSAEDLLAFVKGTDAEALFTGSSEATKAMTSARFVLSGTLDSHRKMPKGAFSLRSWLCDPTPGTLWITWTASMADELRPLISAWTDILLAEILSMTEDLKRRIWFFIDELGNLEKLNTLETGIAMGRKRGLCIVAGLQSSAQLPKIYGREGATVLRSSFSTLVALRTAKGDVETAKDLSAALGEHEVERVRKSDNRGGLGRGATSSRQTVHEREPVVTAGEIARLPKLTGYISVAGEFPIARFKAKYRTYPERVPPIVAPSSGIFNPATPAVSGP
ncbi:MAG: type IV secretion system DNA-binding domain-containing protein [Inquilinus sp.]|uniref:type IV secretion system DNA-binding domain-containing protein n=1 Tax=Inquilinus sp. TaxID=1932117 RepID=UPI003F381963